MVEADTQRLLRKRISGSELANENLQFAKQLFESCVFERAYNTCLEIVQEYEFAFTKSSRSTILPRALGLLFECALEKQCNLEAILILNRLKFEFGESDQSILCELRRSECVRSKKTSEIQGKRGLNLREFENISRDSDVFLVSKAWLTSIKSESAIENPIFNDDLLLPIDPTQYIYDIDILEDNRYLHPLLIEHIHYELIPANTFLSYYEEYGCVYPIKRTKTDQTLEIHYPLIQVYGLKPASFLYIQTSKRSTITVLRDKIHRYINKTVHFRLWLFDLSLVSQRFLTVISSKCYILTYFPGGRLLQSPQETIEESGLGSQCLHLFVEVADDMGVYYLTESQPETTQQVCKRCKNEGNLNKKCKKCGENLFCSDNCYSSGMTLHIPFCEPNISCFSSLFGRKNQRKEYYRTLKGLINTGNQGSVNAGIQAMLAFSDFSMDFIQGKMTDLACKGDNSRIITEISKVFQELREYGGKAVSAGRIIAILAKNQPEIYIKTPLKAREFLTLLISALHSALKQPEIPNFICDNIDIPESDRFWVTQMAKELNPIAISLYGVIESIVYRSCGHNKSQFQWFSVLGLPYPSEKWTNKVVYRYISMEDRPKKIEAEVVLPLSFSQLKSVLRPLSPQRLLFASFFLGKLSWVDDSNLVQPYNEDDPPLLAYEIPLEISDLRLCVVYQMGCKDVFLPRVVYYDPNSTIFDLQKAVFNALSPSIQGNTELNTLQSSLELYSLHIIHDFPDNCPFCHSSGSDSCPFPQNMDVLLPSSLPPFNLRLIWSSNQLFIQSNMDQTEGIIRETVVTLRNCIDYFSKPENDKDMMCEKCAQIVSTHKVQIIKRFPRHLIIEIERVGSDSSLNVDFPLTNLTLTTEIAQNRYNLVGFIVENGSNHRISDSFAVTRLGNRWFRCDDSGITEPHLQAVVSKPVSLLFYDCYQSERLY